MKVLKISDIEKRINSTYNTIKKFIESDPKYYKKVDNVLHATNLGMDNPSSNQRNCWKVSCLTSC